MNLDELKKLFAYRQDGELVRISTINARTKIGNIAGRIGKRGYKYLTVRDKKLYNHRVIWLIHYGNLPEFIDHIDGNKLNNKIENLRACSVGQNLCNAKIKSNNKSGIKGVAWFKPHQKWRARINLNKKEYHLGYFDSKEKAEQAVIVGRLKIHQEFARHA